VSIDCCAPLQYRCDVKRDHCDVYFDRRVARGESSHLGCRGDGLEHPRVSAILKSVRDSAAHGVGFETDSQAESLLIAEASAMRLPACRGPAQGGFNKTDRSARERFLRLADEVGEANESKARRVRVQTLTRDLRCRFFPLASLAGEVQKDFPHLTKKTVQGVSRLVRSRALNPWLDRFGRMSFDSAFRHSTTKGARPSRTVRGAGRPRHRGNHCGNVQLGHDVLNLIPARRTGAHG
jgi:hypothetical protein